MEKATKTKNKTALECAKAIPVERTRNIVLDRLQGKTLGMLAPRYHITRERIRQIALRGMEYCKGCDEEQYRWIVHDYAVSLEEFCALTGLGQESYRYLKSTTPKAKDLQPFENLQNENLPADLQMKFDQYIHRNQIYDNGEYIDRNRTAIIEHIMKQLNRDVTSDEFTPLYKQFIVEHGLEDEPKFAFSERFYDTFFTRSKKILCKFRHTFRYYEISEESMSRFLEEINFAEIQDVEISTQYFMDRYPEIMEKYDIRDQYELHSLLRKHVPESHSIRFGRQPILMIGNCDREKQVQQLCLDNMPIRPVDLAKKYEETYGVASSTVIMNFFGGLKCYYHEGYYQKR